MKNLMHGRKNPNLGIFNFHKSWFIFYLLVLPLMSWGQAKPEKTMGDHFFSGQVHAALYNPITFNQDLRNIMDLTDSLKITPENWSKDDREILAEFVEIGLNRHELKTDKEFFLFAAPIIEHGAEESVKQTISLGLLYLSGLGVEKDYDKAKTLLEKAIEKKDYTAYNYLASLYLMPDWPQANNEKAIQFYKEGIKHKDYMAMSTFGLLTYFGQNGIEKDTETGLSLLTEAAENNNSIALQTLYMIYSSGISGTTIDEKKAFLYLKKLAELTYNVNYLGLLAEAYEKGRGVEKDYCKALKLYEEILPINPTNYQARTFIREAYMLGIDPCRD